MNILFITSEVFFFLAFFWAFFDASLFPGSYNMPGRAEFTGGTWPPKGVVPFNPFDLPLMNTLILLLSGTTVTWAHHALIEGDNKSAVRGLWLTASRICRCNPWGTSGFDPVPDIRRERHPAAPWRYGRWRRP